MAEDDPVRVQNALVYPAALKQAKVPSEMHLYPTGGHGSGLRRTADAAATWPDRVGFHLQPRNRKAISRVLASCLKDLPGD